MWTNRLTPDEAEAVRVLADRAQAADGVPPLNEAARFALRDDSGRHLLAADGSGLAGYLQWEPGYRTAQLVVDPSRRRQGIGRRLLTHLLDHLAVDPVAVHDPQTLPKSAPAPEIPVASALFGSEPGGRPGTGREGKDATWGVWAFGDQAPARGFAAALGLVPGRGLLVMERSLDGATEPDARGLVLRGYQPSDEAALLAVNAAAFAHHPEQGALDRTGLAARMAEPWFDPSGLILGFDEAGLAGFHWTKLVAGVGEVYVIGVAPRAQGRGYGRVLLQAGLHHLALAGAAHVLLYVDMAEAVAVRMYESAGFRVATRDVLYAPEHGSVQKRERS